MDREEPAGQQPLNTSDAEAGPEGAVTFGSWLRRNAVSIVVFAALAVFVCTRFNPLYVLEVALGLGLVVFIHELGHFLAAKWCDVHVETFSVGFGPPVPGCLYRRGETTYMLAMIPLGGYVKMVGEGSDGEEGEDDPRSFKNKTVGQRMLIMSAGVFMNLVMAAGCFVFVYMTRGVEELSGVVGGVNAGSPAWVEGVRSGERIARIGNTIDPQFEDIKPAVMHTDAGQRLPVVLESPGGARREMAIEPTREDSPVPVIGITANQRLTLSSLERSRPSPARLGSAAARAEPKFEYGDSVVATTDPDAAGADPYDPLRLKDLPPKPFGTGERDDRDVFEFQARLRKLAGRPVALKVRAKGDGGAERVVVVEPAFHRTLGLRMRMDKVTAVRKESPAARGEQPVKPGDVIRSVELAQPDGSRVRHDTAPQGAAGGDGVRVEPLDPVRLADVVADWLDRLDALPESQRRPEHRAVKLTVVRTVDHTPKPVELLLELRPEDEAYRGSREDPGGSYRAPASVPVLGVAYRVQTVVDAVEPGSPAEQAGLQKDDILRDVELNLVGPSGKPEPSWCRLEAGHTDQWAAVFALLQYADGPDVRLRVERGGQALAEPVALTAGEDKSWPSADLGLMFEADRRLVRAAGLLEACSLGMTRTVRTAGIIYSNLRGLIVGRISPKMISGPLTIANVSYRIAKIDIFEFILFLGMINVNLAVVNFLPIPVLDGGHMVFLTYEGLVGRPPSETVRVAATFIGLGLIVSLFVFVIVMDVLRLFF